MKILLSPEINSLKKAEETINQLELYSNANPNTNPNATLLEKHPAENPGNANLILTLTRMALTINLNASLCFREFLSAHHLQLLSINQSINQSKQD